MFYLKEILKLLKIYWIRFLLYFFSAGLIFFSPLLHEKFMNNESIQKEVRSDRFLALVDGDQNYRRVARKVEGLPGVKVVKLVTPEDLRGKTQGLANQLGNELAKDVVDLNMASIEVEFQTHLSMKAKELIQSYLKKLAGEDHVVVGPISRGDEKGIEWMGKAEGLREMAFLASKILGLLLCLTLFVLVKKVIDRRGYLLERFQRKKAQGFRLLLTGQLVLLLPTFLLAFAVKDLGEFEYIVFASLMLLTLSSLRGKSQWAA